MAAKVGYVGPAARFDASTLDKTKELLVFEVDPGNTTRLLEGLATVAVQDVPAILAAVSSHNIGIELMTALKVFADIKMAGG